MRTTQLLAFTMIVACLEATSVASETTTAPKPIATQLYDDAMSLFERGEFERACEEYAESQRLDPQLGTLVHLADCYAKLGKTASAWALFKEAAEIATQRNDWRQELARSRVAELEPNVCKLTIRPDPGAPEGLEITSNGSAIGRTLFGSPIPVDPGEYLLVARANGFEDWSRKVAITADTPSTLVEIPPLTAKPSATADPPQPASALPLVKTVDAMQILPAPLPQDSRAFRRSLGYVLGAVGVAGIGVGVGFGIAKEAKQSDRDSANACSTNTSCTALDKIKVDQLTSEARTRAIVANVGFVVGGVALATGAILVITGWSRGDTSAGAQGQPWVGDKSAGFTAGGTW